MTIGQRDKRALAVLAVAVTVIILFQMSSRDSSPAAVVVASDSVPAAEKRLARMRQMAAVTPGKQETLKQVAAELAQREKGLILADTAAQAQAQLLQILRRIGRAQTPVVDIRGNEFGQPKPFGDDYGEVSVSVSMECGIEQVVNVLADLTAQPELIATTDLRIGATSNKEKLVPVRVTVSGLVPKRLLPEKKGPGQL